MYPFLSRITPDPRLCWRKSPSPPCPPWKRWSKKSSMLESPPDGGDLRLTFTVVSVLMFTTLSSTLSAICEKELERSTGDGMERGLASATPEAPLAARTPWETTVPIRIPTPKVTAMTKAGNARLLLPIILKLSLRPRNPLAPRHPKYTPDRGFRHILPAPWYRYGLTSATILKP